MAVVVAVVGCGAGMDEHIGANALHVWNTVSLNGCGNLKQTFLATRTSQKPTSRKYHTTLGYDRLLNVTADRTLFPSTLTQAPITTESDESAMNFDYYRGLFDPEHPKTPVYHHVG